MSVFIASLLMLTKQAKGHPTYYQQLSVNVCVIAMFDDEQASSRSFQPSKSTVSNTTESR
jgi:hypothetical protein